ncbi:MAG: AMP-binding protein [Desulfobacterales bacterium]|nr:AMP-binding protein [Desulfobacterales bacterium]
MEGFIPYPKEKADAYLQTGAWLGLTITDILDRNAAAYPDKEALVDEKTRLTYSRLRDKADQLAAGLLELGLGKGDCVVLQLPNCIEFAYAYFACQRIGLITVTAIPRHSLREIDHFCTLTDAAAWIGLPRLRRTDYTDMIETLRSRHPDLRIIMAGEATDGAICLSDLMAGEGRLPADPQRFGPQATDVSHLMPTGGTTGLPKLVPRTHNDYISNAASAARIQHSGPGSTHMVILPVAHNSGLLALVSGLVAWGKVVLCPSTKVQDILSWIEKYKVTFTAMVPTLLLDLMAQPDFAKYDLSSLELIQGGGAHVPAELVKEVKQRIACFFVNGFGMAEGPLIRTPVDAPPEVVVHTVGKPICPYDQMKIIDEEGRQVPQGVEGELTARGPGIFTGYYKAPEANRESFTQDGFFKTGDLARLDPQGNFIITGRKKDVIIRGAENISATEVEDLVLSHPDVLDVAAVGMPDDRLGERVCIYVRVAPGKELTFEGLIDHLKRQGASVLFLPERMEVVAELPLTAVDKVDKKALREDIIKKLAASAG